ncbi:hypothetical protein KWV16_14295 [Clostridioides difficile]|nr:hypothetical protein [Clostridioides difficile]
MRCQKTPLVGHCNFKRIMLLKVLKMLNLFWGFILTMWYVNKAKAEAYGLVDFILY